ncbi:hypothetical protein GOODEAATRI_009217 [Goodea atripinnis]|uniref:Ubiquitin specific peptidase 34 n=1 Tax=Goodea atripinnis TaxID=208336 RepID=A0ABV0PCP4_9TELE
MFRSTRSLHLPTRELPLSPDTTVVLHQVYNLLLGLLGRAKLYVDASVHGTTKLVQYFSFMTYCLISKTEKLMFSGYFMDLWNLFQVPKLSEPAIATNHNKQALLSFWYNVCVDCPENVRLVVQNPVVTKNIAFNYILADHDDQEVVLFNRGMLPAYYGILRMCCEQSPTFTRQLASHQNIQWAFKNLTPHASQYPGAVEELFNLMQLFVAQRADMKEEELEDIKQFKKTTISCYLRCLDGRSCWTTLISLPVICCSRLQINSHLCQFNKTPPKQTNDRTDDSYLFRADFSLFSDVKQALIQWQERIDFAHKLLTLLNSYSPPELRNACLVSFGPYLPCRENIKLMGAKNNIRPPRPELNMCLLPSLVESSKDLRALVLLLSIQPPPNIDPSLCPALQELLGRCRLCLQQRSVLELEAKDHKSKAEDEGATPVKRRRVSSDDDRAGNAAAALCMTSSSALPVCNEPKPDHQEALTPTSTSDTETRDSSSLIDPGTEQDPPSPEPTPATSRNLDSSLKEEKMEASSSSSSSSFSSSSSSSLMQEAGEGFVQGEEPEVQQPVGTTEEQEEEQPQGQRGEPPSASSGDMKEVVAKSSSGAALTLPEEDTALPSALGLVGEGPDGTGSHSSPSQVILSGGPPPDMLDMLYRTVEATIAIVTKLSVKALPSS